MKLRKLLPIVFLSVAGLAGCGDTNVYDVNISNLSAITAEWHVGDAARTLTVDATLNGEAVNATQLLNTEIFVTSSNEAVVSVLGFVLTPLSAGDTTIEVAYHSANFKVEISVKPVRTCIEKYGTVHAGTEADPLDNADAVKIGLYTKENNLSSGTSEQDIYIKGIVGKWAQFPGEKKGDTNATSWYLKVGENETAFEVYNCKKANGDCLSDEDVWLGAEVLVFGSIGFYKDTMETVQSTFVRVTGGATRTAPETKTVNVADALKAGKALTSGDTTWDKYVITGFVVNNLGNKTYMIADKNDETSASKQFEIYKGPIELKFKAKVQVTTRIKNYNGTIETNVIEEVKVLEEGTDWVEIAEPAAITGKGLADLFADESGNYKVIYEVTGIITKYYQDKTDFTKYGNFYVKAEGSDTEYLIYGVTAKTSALAWNKYAGVYTFTNPGDFLSNTATKTAKIGDKVTMKLVRCDYTKDGVTTPEACGILVTLTPAN